MVPGGGYSPPIPIRVYVPPNGVMNFGTPDLEQGIHFRDVS